MIKAGWFTDEADINAALFQKLHDFRGGVAKNTELYVWVFLDEFLKTGHKKLFAKSGTDANTQGTCSKIGNTPQIFFALTERCESRFCVFV